MNQKYYHNDYKKLHGIDQTRTKSEKILDQTIRTIRTTEIPTEQKVEKKVKEEHTQLTHSEVIDKVIKNINNNHQAVKLIKPINILKKCINDHSFTSSPEINNIITWQNILLKILQIDNKITGNYGQILPVNESILEILQLLLQLIQKQPLEVKQQEVKQQVMKIQSHLLQRCQLSILYYKLYTDDSFTFNKALSQLKKKLFQYFQSQQEQTKNTQFSLFQYNLILKMFKLPYKKYQWLKGSLLQFFKEFNIQYRQLLPESLLDRYLPTYNEFLNQKGGHSGGEDVNVFGKSKGGRITSVEVVNTDGFDSWASKQ